MHRDASHFTSGVEARQRRPLRINDDASINVCWNAAHSVVRGWLNWHWLGDRLHAEVVTGKVGNIRQLLSNLLRPEVAHIEEDIIFAIYTASLFDLLNDAARNDITGSQVF